MKTRRLVLALLVALGVITFLDRICIGVASGKMMSGLDISTARWSWILSSFILSYGLFQIPIGMWADRAGPRFVILVIVLWWSLFTGLTGLVHGFATLLVVRFLFGIGEAGAYPAMAGVVQRWFPGRERAVAQGCIWGASRFGGALSPILVVPVQNAWGWRAAFGLLSLIGVAWASCWWFGFRNRPSEHPRVSPEELGELDEGPKQAAGAAIAWSRLGRQPQFWLILGMYFCYVWGSWFYFSWLPTYLTKGRGFTDEKMALFASLPFLLATGSNVLGGFLSDRLTSRYGVRIGRKAVAVPALFCSALVLAAASRTSSANAAGILLVLGLTTLDLMLPSAWALCLDVGKAHAGAISGAMNTAGNLGGFICTSAFGYLVERHGYNAPLFLIAGMLMLSAGLYACIDPARPLVTERGAAAAPH